MTIAVVRSVAASTEDRSMLSSAQLRKERTARDLSIDDNAISTSLLRYRLSLDFLTSGVFATRVSLSVDI